MNDKKIKWIIYILILVILSVIFMFVVNETEHDATGKEPEISDVFSEEQDEIEPEEDNQTKESVKKDDSKVDSLESSKEENNSETTPEIDGTIGEDEIIVEGTEDNSSANPSEPSSREWSRDY